MFYDIPYKFCINPYPAGSESDYSLCHILYSLIRLYTVGSLTSSSYLDMTKNDNGQLKNGRWMIPLKKFSRLRVKLTSLLHSTYI